MPSTDEVIPVALALHNSPRRYALLVGSGISQAAGIPTAGDITDNLIRQIAGKEIKSGQNPQDWYKETHEGKSPTFSRLLDEVADLTRIAKPFSVIVLNQMMPQVNPAKLDQLQRI